MHCSKHQQGLNERPMRLPPLHDKDEWGWLISLNFKKPVHWLGYPLYCFRKRLMWGAGPIKIYDSELKTVEMEVTTDKKLIIYKNGKPWIRGLDGASQFVEAKKACGFLNLTTRRHQQTWSVK